MSRELISCDCNTCGVSMNVFYDKKHDYYICDACLEIELEEEDADDELPPLFL